IDYQHFAPALIRRTAEYIRDWASAEQVGAPDRAAWTFPAFAEGAPDEVVLENISAGKTCRQSSHDTAEIPRLSQPVPERGLDIRHDGEPAFARELEPNPWWEGDLELIEEIWAVAIYNFDRVGYRHTVSMQERGRFLQLAVSIDGESWEIAY